MINISKVTKKYGKTIIVDNLSLKINDGTVFGFLGPNGAGKTTTIKMLVGLNKPDTGEIKINKYVASSIQSKQTSGYMPEDPYFYDHLTGYEFLEFCLSLSSDYRSKPQVENSDSSRISSNGIITKMLETVGLSEAKNKMINTYSKGMKQRLGLAQAIIHKPKYIFLDEPLDGLDPIGRNDFKNILRGMKKQGSTIFLNSHILSDVEELCDEIGILNHGKLLYTGKVSEFCKRGELEKRFVELINNKQEGIAN